MDSSADSSKPGACLLNSLATGRVTRRTPRATLNQADRVPTMRYKRQSIQGPVQLVMPVARDGGCS